MFSLAKKCSKIINYKVKYYFETRMISIFFLTLHALETRALNLISNRKYLNAVDSK